MSVSEREGATEGEGESGGDSQGEGEGANEGGVSLAVLTTFPHDLLTDMTYFSLLDVLCLYLL